MFSFHVFVNTSAHIFYFCINNHPYEFKIRTNNDSKLSNDDLGVSWWKRKEERNNNQTKWIISEKVLYCIKWHTGNKLHKWHIALSYFLWACIFLFKAISRWFILRVHAFDLKECFFANVVLRNQWVDHQNKSILFTKHEWSIIIYFCLCNQGDIIPYNTFYTLFSQNSNAFLRKEFVQFKDKSQFTFAQNFLLFLR